jgi:acyl carrier protein phosphodiesterase
MNFLSHIYLSGNSEELILGNFIADSVKGSAYKNYSTGIQKGIILHRHIDTFTDSHPVVEESKKRLRPKYRKYSGVIVDIFYDHFLAANWDNFSSEDLNTFAKKIYTLIQQNKSILPLKSLHFLSYMVNHNILYAYSNKESIARVLKGMSMRTAFESNMELAIHDLSEHYDLFEKEFHLFFPDLQKFVNSQSLI